MDRKIKILKKIDALFGGIAAAVLPASRRGAAPDLCRILVIRPGGIGDAVLIVPALRALKERFPDASISVLAEKRNAGAFTLYRQVDHLLLYDNPSELLSVLRGGFDLVIDSEQWHRLSAVIARLVRAPLSIGFATNNRKRLFSHQVAYSHDDYELMSFLNLLAPLGISATAPVVPFLSVPEQASLRAKELLVPVERRPLLVLFPGASISERRWGAERFRQLAAHLSLRGLAVVVVGGEDDAEEGDHIVRGCGGLNLAGKTSLAESAAVIANSLLLVSGDSGVLHIAVGLGVPTVSLFGPGIQAKWAPKGEGHVVLNKRLECSPCTRFGTTPPCPIGVRCLTEIGVQEVVSSVQRVLEWKFG